MMKGGGKMKKIKMLLLVFMISIFAFTTNVFAESKNEVTLNFKDGIIHDGYVEYSKKQRYNYLKVMI